MSNTAEQLLRPLARRLGAELGGRYAHAAGAAAMAELHRPGAVDLAAGSLAHAQAEARQPIVPIEMIALAYGQAERGDKPHWNFSSGEAPGKQPTRYQWPLLSLSDSGNRPFCRRNQG